jgi:hypothetical protein
MSNPQPTTYNHQAAFQEVNLGFLAKPSSQPEILPVVSKKKAAKEAAGAAAAAAAAERVKVRSFKIEVHCYRLQYSPLSTLVFAGHYEGETKPTYDKS